MMIPGLILLCIIVSGLCAGLETGVVTSRHVQLRASARRGDSTALALLSLIKRPERLLTSFLIGNTLSNIGGGALATVWASARLGEARGSLTATLAMTAAFLVFSEIVPKMYFRQRGNEALLRFMWFMRFTAWIFRPAVLAAARILDRMTGSSRRGAFVTRDELRQLVKESSGRLPAGETRMLEAVFDFGHTSAREVMVPLPDVVALPEMASPDELRDIVRIRGFTRVPVYRERVDHLIGVVNVFDVLYDTSPNETLKGYIRPLLLVPDTQKIHRILLDLQGRREGMALVVNEFGGCVGVITLSDIVEEIMGELADEYEDVEPTIQAMGDAYLIDAGLDIDDLNRALGLNVQKDQFDTVAGLLLKRVGRIPKVGEHIAIGNLDFEVLATHQYGIRRLKLRERKASEEGTGDVGS